MAISYACFVFLAKIRKREITLSEEVTNYIVMESYRTAKTDYIAKKKFLYGESYRLENYSNYAVCT